MSRDGHMAVAYRTTGMGCLAVFLFVWLCGWTIGCVFFTYKALFGESGIDYGGLLFMVPFWCAEFLVFGYMLWHFRSITMFTFYPDRLVIERTLLHYRRQRSIPKEEIEIVRQIKDGGEGDDSFPSWGLAIEGRSNIKLLSRQEIEKSAWLGPIVARWAGVEYESSNKKKYEEV
jgi:hypothetical protein